MHLLSVEAKAPATALGVRRGAVDSKELHLPVELYLPVERRWRS
jgi:hypothetical protein